jgi:hypothetical protein
LCLVSLRIPSSSRSPDHDPHRTIYYLGYLHGRFVGLKHRQLARRVGVIITTGRIRRTLVNKINLLVDSSRSIETSRLALVKAESIFLSRGSGCFGTSRGSSRRSSSTTPPRAGSSSTTSPPPRVRVPRLVTRLVAPLVVDYSASRRLVVDYFASAAGPGASARRAARRRLRCLVQACRRLLHLCHTSGCLSMSRGSSRGSSRRSSSTTQRRAGSSSTTPPRAGSSSTPSPPSRVRVPRHVARLVTRLIACRRLLRLRRAAGCLGTSRGSSRGSSRHSSSTTPPRAGSSSTTLPPLHVRVPQHVLRLVTRLVAPLVVDYSASRRLVVDYSASRRLVVDSFASTVGVPRHVVRLVTRLVAPLVVDYSASRRLVVDYFSSTAHPGASARRVARLADRRAACRRLLRLRRASGCLGTSRGSSFVVDYFTYATRPGASARRAARRVAHCAARRRLLRLRRASGCLGTSRSPSRGSSSTTPCAATSSCGHAGCTSATLCVMTT